MAISQSSPIGIFDSGIGGLTVFATVRAVLPNESILYLGDTARVPYGTKSAETVIRYARECSDFLAERGVKALVIACNTASAYALPDLAGRFNVPVLGVIRPGCEAALAVTKKKCIGVIGTSGTIASNAYGQTLKALDSSVRVVSRACPLFVPLVEEGWIDNEVTRQAAHRYLSGLREEGIDTLIMGCTHYPLLTGVISEELGKGVVLVDSAETTAYTLKKMLAEKEIEAMNTTPSSHIYVTDLPAQFESIAQRFLHTDVPPITRVDL